tara:strand:+ start:6222 stop:8012 length:1791 start_codon:yes stop_codon:yes gene_type:complete
MAIDPGIQKLSEITEQLELANAMKQEEKRAEVNKEVLEQTLRDKALEMSQEQRDAMIALSGAMQGDKLQTLEDKREANLLAQTQLELLGIIAENTEDIGKGGTETSLAQAIGKLAAFFVGPIALGLGVIAGFGEQVIKMGKLFAPGKGEFFKNLITSIRGIPKAVFDSIKSTKIGKAVTDSFTKIFTDITKEIAKRARQVKNISLFVAGTLQAMGNAFKMGILGQKGPMRKGLSSILDDLFKSLKIDFRFKDTKVIKGLADFSKSVGTKLKPTLDVIKGITKFFGLPFVFFSKIISSELKAFKAAQEPIAKFLRKNFNIGVKVTKEGSNAGRTVGRFFSFFRQITQTFATFVRGAFKLGRIIGRFFPLLGTLIVAFDTIKGIFTGFTEETGGLGRKIISALFGGMKAFSQSLVGFLLDLLKNIIAFFAEKLGFSGFAETLKGFSFVDLIGKIFDAVESAVFAVIDFFGSIPERVGDLMSSAGDFLKNMSKNFLKSLLQSILPDPDGGIASRLASKAIPSSVYEYAGLDPYTGDVIEKFDNPIVDKIGQVASINPGVAAAQGMNQLVNNIRGGNTTQVNNFTSDPTDILGDSLLSPN